MGGCETVLMNGFCAPTASKHADSGWQHPRPGILYSRTKQNRHRPPIAREAKDLLFMKAKFWILSLLTSLALSGSAQAANSLKIGDPAPALQVGKWIQG